VALTLKRTIVPASTLRLAGWLVIVGDTGAKPT
jgi:hypothetical protein